MDAFVFVFALVFLPVRGLHDCTVDWFGNVHVLTKEDFKVDVRAIYRASLAKLTEEKAIMVLNENVPVVCAGEIS